MSETSRAAFLLGPQRLDVRSTPIPKPGPGELLVRIEAATTCGTDLKVYRRGGHPRMLQPPCRFGHELAGTVLERGSAVVGWPIGERVVVINSSACGVCPACRSERENLCADLRYLNGAFAQTILIPERFVRTSTYRCPQSVPYELAALTEPVACVLHGIDRFPDEPIETVAVFGAGPIGLMFTAVLASRGHRVTLIDRVRSRLHIGLIMGAASTVQVTDGGELAKAHQIAERIGPVDLVVEATGYPEVWTEAFACVRPGGSMLLYGGYPPQTHVSLDAHALHYTELTVRGAYHHRPATVRHALDLIASGSVDLTPLLSAERPLDEIEAALHAMELRQALKVVIRP